MSYYLTSAKLDGIRGVNKEIDLQFNKGLTLLHGPNGTGKSSVLQAIEWCMTGEIPYMRGGDFAREDAIVNAFTRAKRARAELMFSGPTEFTLVRSKNRTRSTTSGKHKLSLKSDKLYENDEAEDTLMDLLELDTEEIPRSKFLHQETIRDALTYKPSDRSAVIEKLLGTYDIKEFTKAITQDRRINSEIKTIEETIESLRRDRIQFILNLRRGLEQLKKQLIEKGYEDKQLNSSWILTQIDEYRKNIDDISNKLKIGKLIHPDISQDVNSLIEANTRLHKDLTSIDRERMNALQKHQTKIIALQGVVDKYRNALDHFKDYETMDTEALENKKNDLKIKINEINDKISAIQRKLTLYPPRIAAYQNAKDTYETEKGKLDSILKEHGDEYLIVSKIDKIEKDQVEIQQDLTKYTGRQRIVNLAADLINRTKQNNCPVCDQEIDPEILVEHLHSQVSVDISDRISELNKELSSGAREVKRLQSVVEKLSNLKTSTKSLKSKFEDGKNNLEQLIEANVQEINLEKLTQIWEDTIASTQKELEGTNSEYLEIEDKLKQKSFLMQEISQSRKELQSELGVKVEGKKLIKGADDKIIALNEEKKDYETTEDIDNLRDNVQKIDQILDYLRDEKRTQNAEEELPTLTKQMENLEKRKTSLIHLSGSLGSIRKMTTEYQKEASIEQIKALEEMMNEYYSAIPGHPHFQRLKIDIEKQDPLLFSFRAASEREATYIPTRFSTAQLNVAALSIFMSNSRLMRGQLPLLTLDDPTQSMDDAHKEALAGLVSKLTDDFQVIIATEDDETRDYLLKYCKGAMCYELESWEASGPELSILPNSQ